MRYLSCTTITPLSLGCTSGEVALILMSIKLQSCLWNQWVGAVAAASPNPMVRTKVIIIHFVPHVLWSFKLSTL